MAKQLRQATNSTTIDTGTKQSAAQSLSLHSFRVQALLLAIIGFLFYANTFPHESAFDDRMAITDNEYVQRGFAGIPDILTKDAYQSYLEHRNGSNQLSGGRYRPLSLITFAVEQQFMSTDHDNESAKDKDERIVKEMPPRHVINVLLYILSVIALLHLFRKIIFPATPIVAFLAALIFLIHPIHTEVVANVKSRDELLSVLFIACTFIFAYRYKDGHKKTHLFLALTTYFFALLSKEYAAVLIALLPLSFYLLRKETIPGSLRQTLPYLMPLALYLALRFHATTAAPEGATQNILNNPYLYASEPQKIATCLLVLLDYLKLLFFPYPLIADYSYNQIPYASFADPLVWLSVVVYGALFALLYVAVRKRHITEFAVALYLLPLLLVSNFFFNLGAPMGERLIYHSSLGFAMVLAWLIYIAFEQAKTPAMQKGMAAFMAVLVLICGAATIARNKDWKNDSTLFMTDVKKAPNSILVNNNAAAACMLEAKKTNDPAERKEWFERAVAYFSKAIHLYPGYDLARLNRGLSYFNMGYPDRALPDWDSVRRHNPNQPNLDNYLTIAGKYFYSQGMRYASMNNTDSAIIAFKNCVDATPAAPEPWYELGKAYYASRRYPEAMTALNKAVMLAPNKAEALELISQINAMPGMHALPG